LIEVGQSGELVPASNVEAMALSIVGYARDQARARRAGLAGRTAVERQYSLTAMVQQYQGLYDRLLSSR
jgi:hypothetical protein